MAITNNVNLVKIPISISSTNIRITGNTNTNVITKTHINAG